MTTTTVNVTSPPMRVCRGCSAVYPAQRFPNGRAVQWCPACATSRSRRCGTCTVFYPLDSADAVTSGLCPVCRVHPTLWGGDQ